jgi:hypothetical protein
MRNIELMWEMEKSGVLNFITHKKENPYDDDYYKYKHCCLEDEDCDWSWEKKTVHGYFLYYKNAEGDKVSGYKTFCPYHWIQFIFAEVDVESIGQNPEMSLLDCEEGIAP